MKRYVLLFMCMMVILGCGERNPITTTESGLHSNPSYFLGKWRSNTFVTHIDGELAYIHSEYEFYGDNLYRYSESTDSSSDLKYRKELFGEWWVQEKGTTTDVIGVEHTSYLMVFVLTIGGKEAYIGDWFRYWAISYGPDQMVLKNVWFRKIG